MTITEMRELRKLISEAIAATEKAKFAAQGTIAAADLAFAIQQLECALSETETAIRERESK